MFSPDHILDVVNSAIAIDKACFERRSFTLLNHNASGRIESAITVNTSAFITDPLVYVPTGFSNTPHDQMLPDTLMGE